MRSTIIACPFSEQAACWRSEAAHRRACLNRSKMAAPIGLKTVKGYFFDCLCTETEMNLLNGPDGLFYSTGIFEAKVKQLGLKLPESDDSLKEITVGGYGVVHGVLFQEIDGQVVDIHAPGDDSPPPSTSGSSEYNNDTDDTKKSWTSAKVKLLIDLFQKHQKDFCNHMLKKKDVWQMVARALNEKGGQKFTADEVDKKWRGLKERYKKIKDSNKLTGRGRSTWEYMDLLAPVLEKDPAVNPPCIISAGASFSLELMEERPAGTAAAPAPSQSQSQTPTPSRKRKSDMPSWAESFVKDSKKQNKKIRKQLKLIAREERRRNDLFEQFLTTITEK